MMKFAPSDTIDRYEIISYSGGGSFGQVYRAKQVLLDADRAVKFVQQKPGQKIESLLEEVRNLHSAAEDHVVKVFSADLFHIKVRI